MSRSPTLAARLAVSAALVLACVSGTVRHWASLSTLDGVPGLSITDARLQLALEPQAWPLLPQALVLVAAMVAARDCLAERLASILCSLATTGLALQAWPILAERGPSDALAAVTGAGLTLAMLPALALAPTLNSLLLLPNPHDHQGHRDPQGPSPRH